MKHIRKIIFSFFVLTLIFGCTDKITEKKVNLNTFSVNLQDISGSDILEISLPEKRPSKLSIISPDGRLFIIHSLADSISFLPQSDISIANKINFPISTLKGITWVDGKKTEQLVFKKLGKYTVYMADNLETEPENTFHFKQDIELK